MELGNEEIKNRQVICWWPGKMIFSSFLYEHKFYLDFDKDESSNHDAMYLLPSNEKMIIYWLFNVCCHLRSCGISCSSKSINLQFLSAFCVE